MQTLLEEFIGNKIADYKEPCRKGISRGNPIGFGKAKHQAALISTLTSLDLKKLAEQANASYKVLLVWRSQDDFKSYCKSITAEFMFNIDCELMDIASHLTDDYKHGRFHDHTHLFNRFNDINIYNKHLLKYIEERLNHYLYELPNGDVAFNCMAFFLARHSGAPGLIKLYEKVQTKIRERVIDDIVAILKRSEFSDKDKGEAIEKLAWLKA